MFSLINSLFSMMSVQINTPVLIIAFNRPETTKFVIDRIREVKPTKLYVAIDGPRIDVERDKSLCQKVVEITKDIDWDCSAKYLIRETNLGCKHNVVRAISWVLENEDRLIVIEDDIVPTKSFFSFAQELLEKFKNDERIGIISGSNYTPVEDLLSDYLFTKYGHIWGWATWKRVWDKFDVDVPDLEAEVKSGLVHIYFNDAIERRYFKNYFSLWLRRIKMKKENAWGPQFFYFRLRNNFLSVVPRVNLVSNIGNRSSRTESIAAKDTNRWPVDNDFLLTKFGDEVQLKYEYEIHHFLNHINRGNRNHKLSICRFQRIIKRAFKRK